MTTLEQARAWKWLMNELKKVQDPTVHMAMKEDLKRKALRDWGWVPGETSATAPASDAELDDWERDFVNDVKDSATFNLDTRVDKRIAELRQVKVNMLEFIRNGGVLLDIPQEIRTPDIENLYYECLHEYGDELMAQIDNVWGIQA